MNGFKRSKFLRDVAAFFAVTGVGEKSVNIAISIPDDDGLGLKGIVPISVLAQPANNLRYVRITIDGNLVVEDPTAPYEYQWDTTQVSDGTHVVAAIAQYKTRKSQAQIAVTVNNATVPPPPPPPPTGILEKRPPGYNGGDPRLPSSYPNFQYVEVSNASMIVNMTNGVDYFIKLVEPIAYTTKQTDPDAFKCIHLNGGRHVVVVGGDVRIDSGALSGRQSEPLGFLVDGGTDGGIVHFEGLYVRANNPITIRTRRTIQIEWCVLEAAYFRPTSDPAHSDLVQVWGTTTGPGGHTPCEAIWMHYVTCFTDYTGLSNLVQRTPTNRTTDYAEPKTWWRHKIDIHPRMVGSLGEAGNYCYHSGSPTGGNGPGWQNFGPYTVYDGEVYAELPQGGGGAYVRPIDGICCLRSLDSGLWIFPYEIKSPSGQTLYTSPAEPTGGNAPYSVSGPGAPGNYLTFDRVGPLSKQKWIIGQPPLVEGAVAEGTGVQGQARRVFVPRGTVGMNYEPKGYAN